MRSHGMTMPEVLTVTDLHKSYGDREVVAGISFAIQKGECFGLLGPNGAGKTTTLRCILGLTGPGSGSIRLVGRSEEHTSELQSH